MKTYLLAITYRDSPTGWLKHEFFNFDAINISDAFTQAKNILDCTDTTNFTIVSLNENNYKSPFTHEEFIKP